MAFQNPSEENFQLLISAFNQLNEALVILDNELKIIGKNQAAEALFSDKKLNQSPFYYDVFPELKGSQFQDFHADPSKAELEKETSGQLIHQIKRIKGGYTVKLTPHKATVSLDVLFNTMPEGVVYEDALGMPILMNQAAEKISGLTLEHIQGFIPMPPDYHVIYPDGSLFPIEEHPTLVALRTGKPVMNEIMGLFNPSIEKYKWISLNAVPEFKPGEKHPHQVFATFTDITEQVEAEQKLKSQSELLELMVHTSTTYINISEDELHETIQLSLQKLGEFVDADRMYIFEYDWDQYTTKNTYEWCAPGIEPQIEHLKETTLEGIEEWTSKHLKGEMFYIEDVMALGMEDSSRQILEPQGVQSMLAMPILDKNSCVGFVGLDSVKKKHRYSENEFNLLKIFTGILANVYHRLQSERQLKERVKEFNTIYEVTRLTIAEGLKEQEILKKVAEIIPGGFYEPSETSAKISYEGNEFISSHFSESDHLISEKIFINGKEAGKLEVFIPLHKEFLEEKFTLIQTIANVLGQHFESKKNLLESQRNERQLKNLLNSQTSYVLRTDLLGNHTYWNEKFAEEFGWLYGPEGLDHGNALQSICEYHHGKTFDVVQKCVEFPGRIFPVELDKPSREGIIITTLWEFVALLDDRGIPSEIQCMGINISDRKKAVDQLIASENRLRGLLESQTNYVIRTDLQGRHTFWNKKFEEDFGYIYPTKGLAESDSLTSICEYDQDKAREAVEKCIVEPGKIVQVELDKPTRSGKIMTTLWDFVCLSDSAGVPFEMQCVGIDITDRKETEQKLKDSEEKYRVLFEESPDGYLIIKDGKFIDCNKAAMNLLGRTKEEVVGMAPYEISPEIQPDGRVSKEAAYDLLQKTEKEGHAYFEWVHCRKDGSEFLAEITLSKILFNGEEVFFTSWKNITEKRATEIALINSEERFRQIAEHTGSVIWELDEKGLYSYIGPLAKRVYGYEPSEIVGKKYFWELFPKKQQEELKAIGLQYLEQGQELYDWENPIERKDGKTIWVSSFGSAIRRKDGKITGYRGADYDITARKTAEQELRKFRIISDKASYGTVITEYGTRKITYCNDTFAKMHGYEVDELIGKEIFCLHTPEQLEYYLEQIYPDYVKNKEYALKEFGRKRKDGSTFPGLVTAKLFFDEEGSPIFNAATVVDITQEKIIEEQIREQNIRFKAIIDAIPDLLYIMDVEGNYLEYFSSKLENNIGDFSYLVGGNLFDFFPAEHSKIHIDQIHKALRENKITTYEYEGMRGYEGRFFESRIVPMTDSKVLRFVREITQRIKNESEIKKLTLAIEQSPVAIIITDLEGKLDYMSPAFLTMTGYSHEELYQNPIGMIKSGLTDAEIYTSLWQTIKSGKNFQTEWRNRRKSGEIFWENISITPILDQDGKIKNFLAVKQDITERKNYEEEIIQLNQNLEQRILERTKELENSNLELELARNEADTANQAKSEFLSRMSHELRTPMNSILGFAQLLEFTELTEKQHKNLEYILKSGNHLLQLINEVLDIAKIEAGKVSVSLEPIELIGVIREVADSVMPFADGKSIVVHLPSDHLKKIYVLADLQRLKQILINLLNNAIKYNRKGGEVWITTEPIQDKNERRFIRISIIDNGVGISEENLPKLFKPFERVGGEVETIEGTGLGLSVVEKLAQLMRGKVGVESKVGEGSKFWIELPGSEANPNAMENLVESDGLNLSNQDTKGRLLLVEDNVSNIELIKELLRSLKPGIEVINTMYGLEAIQLTKEYKPSLILLDLNLPDTSGAKVLETLKNDPETKDLPIVVVSADATTKQMEFILSKGADQYITKPINVGQLIKIFDQYLKYATYE
jgi:PAS domain S-box-containing protein